jgi:hypothetical protein
MAARLIQPQRGLLLRGENLSRALVFSSFWGSIFYLLAFVSQLLTFRRAPAEVQGRTVVAGAGLFVGGFVGLGTLLIAVVSAITGRTPSEQARAQLGTAGESRGLLGATLSAGLGSLLPPLACLASYAPGFSQHKPGAAVMSSGARSGRILSCDECYAPRLPLGALHVLMPKGA